jgi:hypothetical protein
MLNALVLEGSNDQLIANVYRDDFLLRPKFISEGVANRREAACQRGGLRTWILEGRDS